MSLPPNRNILADYLNSVYIETGMYRGDSLRLAIDAGFKTIYAIDYFTEWIIFCKSRFKLNAINSGFVGISKLHLINDTSVFGLYETLVKINSQIATIFLDAHSQFLEEETEAPCPYPLMDELLTIKEFGNPNSTIIIDDILHLTHPDVTGWTKKNIEDAVLDINPNYKIQYIANPVKNNLLIATP